MADSLRSTTEKAAVREVIACDEELRAAAHAGDSVTVDRLYAPEFVLNSPGNRIQSRAEKLEVIRERKARQTNYERVIEAAYLAGEVVVLMGRERLVWEGTGTNRDGRLTRRRFTTAWRRVDGGWKQFLRQAATLPDEEG